MNKIKVIQITDSLNVGGTEVLAVNIANTFLDFDIESHFCTTRQEGFLKQKINKEVGYIHLKRKSIFDFKALLKLKKYLKSNDINIMHVHSTSLFFASCLYIIHPKVKIFWHNHTGANVNLKGLKLLIIKTLTLCFANGIINVNEDLCSWSKKVLKHKNCIKLNNFPLFSDLEKKTVLKGTFNKRIVCLAALRQEKDHLNLLEAFKIINYKYPLWSIHLVGKDYKNNYSNAIKKFVKENNLKESVFLYGMCSDIKNILEQSTIGVLSSKNEGLPISLLEYGLVKLPVLVTDVGECRKTVFNKNAVVPSEKSDLFAKYLLKIIENKNLREEISLNLHHNIITNFSKEIFMKKIKNFYLDI